MIEISARERGRQNKAGGGAQRNPRARAPKIFQACEAGDRDVAATNCDETRRNQLIATNCRPLRGLDWLYRARFLGFRCAPPQALFCRLLRRLKTGCATRDLLRRLKTGCATRDLLRRLKTGCATRDLLRRLKTRCSAHEKLRVMASLTVGLLRRTLLFFALLCLVSPAGAQSGDQQLRWGGDAEGGAPYLLPNPKNPREIIGFEIDLMNAVGKQLNRKSVFVQNQWDGLIPGLQRGNY